MIDEECLADIRGAAGFDGATFNAKAVRFLLRLLDEARADAATMREAYDAATRRIRDEEAAHKALRAEANRLHDALLDARAERDAERQRADRLAETLESVRDCKKDRCKQCQVLIHHALAHPGKGEPQG